MSQILIVDDDRTARKGLYFTLNSVVDEVHEAESVNEAKSHLKEREFDIIISDLRIPQENDGINFVKEIIQMFPLTPVLMVTAYGSVNSAVEAIKAGAYDYITKDFGKEEIVLKIKKMLETRKLWLSNIRLSQEVNALKDKYVIQQAQDEIIGDSKIIKSMLETVRRVGLDKDSTVLVQGESGTGKELIAKSIHRNSPERNTNKFIVVDVSSMPTTLLESQLFGHEKGAFTDAREKHIGYFEAAKHGTVFLDEIGDFPLELQVKLLRFLQEKTFVRVGGVDSIFSDVRIIAATNKDLEDLASKGEFRPDLFYRLNVVKIQLPALRERREDIAKLIEYFINKFEVLKNRELIFPENVINKMIDYDWPGNVRQLKNLIESLYIISPSDEVSEESLNFETTQNNIVINDLADSVIELPFKEAKQKIIEKFENMYIKHHWEKHRGNISKIASIVGVSREGLSKKIKKYDLKSN
ncbi:MAG: sigma-54 dependent transcriptional regulator [Bacteroidota bacterium]